MGSASATSLSRTVMLVSAEAQVTNQSRIMGALCDYAELSSVDALRREYPAGTGFDASSAIEYLYGRRLARRNDYWSVFDELKQITL